MSLHVLCAGQWRSSCSEYKLCLHPLHTSQGKRLTDGLEQQLNDEYNRLEDDWDDDDDDGMETDSDL